MIGEELRVRIRRLFYAEHWKVGTIAEQLGVHHTTVSHAIESERFVNVRHRQRGAVLDSYKRLIDETLERYPRLRATRLLEMIRPRGYTGSARTLRRYVRTVRKAARAEVFLRLCTLPGEQAQVDWASFGTMKIGRSERRLSCFVMVLSWSRAMYARFALDQSLDSFVLGHVLAFEALGGVARTILYDNLKSVVLERDGDHVRYHPRMLDLAGHYHFLPRPCAPYRGNEKGRVERQIHYLRHSFFAARSFGSVHDLNSQLRTWIETIAHARPGPGDADGRPVGVLLDEERQRLLPLPEHRFPCESVVPVASGKTPYVRFDKNDYSIPADFVRRPLTLIVSEDIVRVCDGETEVARHVRSWDRGRRIDNPAHIRDLADRKRHARLATTRDRLRAECPHADAFIAALVERQASMTSQTRRLRALLDTYGAEQLDLALADALDRGAISAEAVAHLLDQRRRARGALPPVDLVLPDDPRVRDLRVTPHDLSRYDELTRTRKDLESHE